MIRKKKIKDSDQVRVTFILPGDHPYGEVAVVGDFNDWDPSANPFVRRSNQTYSTAAVLDAGERYAFRYLCEDGSWVNDEAADDYEPNDFGDTNGVVVT